MAIEVCTSLGFPVAPSKVVGPSPVLTFLGIEIDSVAWELRLPKEKLHNLQGLITQWLDKRKASKQELQSIIGHLAQAASVVKP